MTVAIQSGFCAADRQVCDAVGLLRVHLRRGEVPAGQAGALTAAGFGKWSSADGASALRRVRCSAGLSLTLCQPPREPGAVSADRSRTPATGPRGLKDWNPRLRSPARVAVTGRRAPAARKPGGTVEHDPFEPRQLAQGIQCRPRRPRRSPSTAAPNAPVRVSGAGGADHTPIPEPVVPPPPTHCHRHGRPMVPSQLPPRTDNAHCLPVRYRSSNHLMARGSRSFLNPGFGSW